MSPEARVGMNMYAFEVSQIRAGLRPPFPDTPLVGDISVSKVQVYEILKVLHRMYGLIDSTLLRGLGVESEEVIKRRLYHWEIMHRSIRVENFSCL